MIGTKISDGLGNGYKLKVDSEGAIEVVIHPHPPLNETITSLPFSQFFTDDGTATGSNNMIVDGSVNTQTFYVAPSNEFDIYINSITIQISDPGARLDRFGALTALTNGVKFYYQNASIGELVISEAIKTNLDFFRDATGGKNFGSGTDAWKADIAGGAGEDTYFPEIDLQERFGLMWGLHLPKDSTGILAFDVRDNLAGLSTFNIKAYGIRI